MRLNQETEMNIESKSKDVPSTGGNDGGGSVPSGFILKLYQMVNGAPDEVITVSLTPKVQIFSKNIGGQPIRRNNDFFT